MVTEPTSGRRGRRHGISRTATRAVALVVGYVALMFALGLPLITSRRELLATSALTVAELLFLTAIVAAAAAWALTRARPWRPELATALIAVPLPAGLIALAIWAASR